MKHKKTSRHSIKRRWLINHLGIMLLVLILIDIALCYSIRVYFYTNAQQYMTTKLNAVSGELHNISDNTDINFRTALNNTVESFSDKDKMEIMVIDSQGQVMLTSSGFKPETKEKMPDFESLSPGGTSVWQGSLSTGENVIAISKDISEFAAGYSCLRVVSSMTEVHENIVSLCLVISSICAAIYILLFFTGTYFIRSIVNPLLVINSKAGKFATGDFSEKIDLKSMQDDEIKSLGDSLNKMASALEVSDAMKNEFISSVSHELRTPLTAIKGWSETIVGEDTDSAILSKGLQVIMKETERLAQMVEELLDFSRMQTGHFSLERTKLDILAELGDAVVTYEQKAAKEGIELIYKEPEYLPLIEGDKNRIHQVFINVIDNAIKYSDKGDTVQIDATERNGNIVITVNDMGCGIKAADLPRVKEKFFKANHTRRGSGIGLAVANEIVEGHGGNISITSKENVGTTVTISLPYIKQENNQLR